MKPRHTRNSLIGVGRRGREQPQCSIFFIAAWDMRPEPRPETKDGTGELRTRPEQERETAAKGSRRELMKNAKSPKSRRALLWYSALVSVASDSFVGCSAR